jgi:hypothetical protein
MPSTAHFASARSDLIVVESSSVPQYEGGRLIGTKPGRLHRFAEHRCKVEGQKSIDFMRERIKAPDGPGLWETRRLRRARRGSLLSELAVAPTSTACARSCKAEEDGPSRDAAWWTVAQAVLERADVSPSVKPGGQAPVRARHETVVT